ncbi:uncharacterized protein LOC133173649 [Saccostrea echinata]|uniref:uncharacterized protein LOC133173649 n=1 Tax=Saccostrea echinata TaxID=191078 RepID=UPI002A7FBC3B|nr:uncharacterized protein LOC133173649 [Saccostrea echinata]XP_061164620.1 uncharacterized protein LOC133173649 [Saccostrea echinata]
MESNSSITDLSDPRRPQKLSEMFSEIYDNQWTEAFERLGLEAKTDSDRSDCVITKRLLDILMECYAFCKHESEKQRRRLVASLMFLDDAEADPTTTLSQSTSTKLNEFIKSVATELATHIKKKFPNKEELRALQNYQDRCLEVCWYASIQTPPMYLTADFSKFDSECHRGYQNSGKFVDFVVWPAIYIERNGALLNKAVVEGCNEHKPTQQNGYMISTKSDPSQKFENNNTICVSSTPTTADNVDGKHIARIQIRAPKDTEYENVIKKVNNSKNPDVVVKQPPLLPSLSAKELEIKKSELKDIKSTERGQQDNEATASKKESPNPQLKRLSSQEPTLQMTPSAILDVSPEELEDRKSALKETRSSDSRQQPKEIGTFNFN